MSDRTSPEKIEQWNFFELALRAHIGANPFLDVDFSARFSHQDRTITAEGFYDADDVFRVRFCPNALGRWSYETISNSHELHGKTGEFECVAPEEGNHGPVAVVDTFHFAHADGTPYYPFGTTCYAWIHQGEALEEQTLETLRDGPFNKLRMCVFPKHYAYSSNEPQYYPFQRADSGEWDFTCFDPQFFRHLEQRVAQLMELGVEADIILFHPYDRWGFAQMDADSDDRYLRYVIARLSAYRNVWWSLANEYDLMEEKALADWDRFFRIVQECDPYQHPRSIHNCRSFYDHTKPQVTHASIQDSHLERVWEWRESFGKPIVVDECCYEGNIKEQWGSISARELTHRFWAGIAAGGYVGHGETYRHPDDVLWWSKGGVLRGESPARIAFLREIVEAGPPRGLEPVELGPYTAGASKGDEYYLVYFGLYQPVERPITLPEGGEYRVEIIDTWEMTITPLEGTFSGAFRTALPGKPYMGLRMQKV